MSEIAHLTIAATAPFDSSFKHQHTMTSSTQPIDPSSSSSPITIKTLSLQDFECLETRPKFLREMRESLMRIGTFYIKDHGVSTEMTAGAMKTVQEYFALPLEEKRKMLIGKSRHFRGYKLIGEEFTGKNLDHREQLQFGPEQTAISDFAPSVSPDYQGLQGPNQWPQSTLDLLPSFQPTILDFMTQLETLSRTLLEAVALSLGLKGSFFREMFGPDPYYRLKCAKYPSVSKEARIGCGAHKDTGFLTVLLQDMVGGLQGQDPATGLWMDTKPVPDTFIVTMGESIERLTGGLYHATVHRVLNNTSGHDRFSIPFFFDPSLEAVIPHSIHLPSGAAVSSAIEATYPSPSSPSPMSYSDSIMAEVEAMVHAFDAHDLSTSGETSDEDAFSSPSPSTPATSYGRFAGWSNGEHVFETVHRCHPEVYSRWYNREQ